MIRFDNKKLNKEWNELMTLREIACDEKVPIEKSIEIREEQAKKFKHYKFMKNLQNAIQKVGDNNDLGIN